MTNAHPSPDDAPARNAAEAPARVSTLDDVAGVEPSLRRCGGGGCTREELERLYAEQRALQQEIVAIERQLVDKQEALQAEAEARRSAEAGLQAAERHRHDAQRLESLGVLAGGLAHQFNNLLTIIGGHVGLAAAEAMPGSTTAHSLEEIRLATQRAAGLCRQMLDAAGHSFAVRRLLDPRLVLDEALVLAGRGEPGRCALEYVPALLALPRVRGVAAQLQQAVAALLLNAFEAARGSQGLVRVALHDVPLDPRQAATLSTPVRPGHFVCFEVHDDGAGIEPEARGRIFEPFFTSKGLGRGLGLAVAAGIARAHGGGIGVDTQPGAGTTFRLFVPAVEAAPTGN